MKSVFWVTILIVLLASLIMCGCAQSNPAAAPAPSTTFSAPALTNSTTLSSPTSVPATSTQASGGQPIVWRYNGTMAPTSSMTKAEQKWTDLVNQRCQGRFKIQFYPSAQLYASLDLSSALSAGAIQMSECTPASLAGLVPSVNVLEIPLAFKDFAELDTFLGKNEDIIDQEMRSKGLHLLFFINGGTESGPITINKAVRTLADWKGLRLRTTGAVGSLMVQAFGASPISMSGGDVYTALQRGTIDGALSGYATFVERNLYEVCKYFPDYMLVYSYFPQVVNLDAWNKLPADIQKIMIEAGQEVDKDEAAVTEKENADARATMLKAGLQPVTIAPDEWAKWVDLCRSTWPKALSGSPAAQKILQALPSE